MCIRDRLVSITDDGFCEIKARVEKHAERHEALAKQEEGRGNHPRFIKPYIAVEPVLAISSKVFRKVRKGMKEDEVSHQLGEPMDEESYLVDNEVYEVRFYKVNSRWREKPPEHLPVIFKDGVVVGTNMKIYNQFLKNPFRSKQSLSKIEDYQ